MITTAVRNETTAGFAGDACAYTWENLLLACKPCNADAKCNHIPLRSDGQRCRRPGGSLCEELPILIDPFDPDEPDPETVLRYEWTADPVPAARVEPVEGPYEDRAREIIDILCLNDLLLVGKRGASGLRLRSCLMALRRLVEEGGETDGDEFRHHRRALRLACEPYAEFAGFARQLVREEPELAAIVFGTDA